MNVLSCATPRFLCRLFSVLLLALSPVAAQDEDEMPREDIPANQPVPGYDLDTRALLLARRYMQGGEDGRQALYEALDLMGWSVRDVKNRVLRAPPAGANTGLAMRDHELEELFINPAEQPTVRFISVAQALAVPFEDADPEELAQDLLETIRTSAESSQPQQRFWARFIVALGRVSQANYDLMGAAPVPLMQPDPSRLKALEKAGVVNPFQLMKEMQPRPVWAEDDPVLAPSKRPERTEDDTRESITERDEKRFNEISREYGDLAAKMASKDPAVRAAAQERMETLGVEMARISQRMQAAALQQSADSMKAFNRGQDEEEEEEDDDEEEEDDDEQRFLAEFRDQPLSLLQIGLISRVLAADVRLRATGGRSSKPQAQMASRPLPLAMLFFAQAPTSFGDQVAGAGSDIWATGWGAYTGAVLEHHLPDSKFSKGVAIANTIIAWFKTIMTVAQQKITIEVENAPLIRTKTRAAGERRTARAKVVIDFPKSDVLKAIRAAGNLTTVDLQMPDGGPVSGAKVVWRLNEGSYNNKYQTANGGWTYKPELAVVQFAAAGGKDAYVSFTNDSGEATITIEGVPQRKNLSSRVRPYPRRAAVGVEVTVKVGNLTQDLNDAINTAMGGPIFGGLGFIADMVLRTSFFFQASKPFEVRDWKEPAWEGDFKITVKASGSKRQKGDKGGPDTEYTWSMDRVMEGRLHTPEWEEEAEQEKDYDADGRHRLEVDGDSRYFSLNDSSSARSRQTHNRYEATGPMQTRPPGPNQLALYSRSEPSGSAELVFTGGKMILDLKPFFGAECIVGRFEQNGRRSSSKAGPEFLSLLGGVYPESFTIIEDNDGSAETIEGSKTFDYTGNLPYVPSFDVTVTVEYRLFKNGPPPKNRPR